MPRSIRKIAKDALGAQARVRGDDPWQRLAGIGIRLAARCSERGVRQLLVAEAVKLSGAQRVLLVEETEGAWRPAGLRLPAGEAAPDLLAAITPWIDEARRTGAARLRHGPEGVSPEHQRSCLVVPLMARKRPLAFLYADVEGAHGRFSDEDRDLLAGLASQAAIALDNARRVEGLVQEARVRARELQASRRRQAGIAGENARLINETKEAIERQTASAEILKVIASSPSDVRPVFDVIVNACLRLISCARAVVLTREGDAFRRAAVANVGEAQARPMGHDMEVLVPINPEENFPSRVFVGGRLLHIPDWNQVELPPHEKMVFERTGYPASVMLPLMRLGECIGVLIVFRATAGAFSDREIALLESFADQAVIAIENARLFNETQEALERQTATAEILKVISGSVTDTQPVFEAIVKSCQRLFSGKAVGLLMANGDLLESVAYADADPDGSKGPVKPWPLDHGSGSGACILDAAVVNVPDAEESTARFPRMRDLAIALGYQSCLSCRYCEVAGRSAVSPSCAPRPAHSMKVR